MSIDRHDPAVRELCDGIPLTYLLSVDDVARVAQDLDLRRLLRVHNVLHVAAKSFDAEGLPGEAALSRSLARLVSSAGHCAIGHAADELIREICQNPVVDSERSE